MSMRNPNGFIRPSYNPLEVADAPTAVTPSAGNQSASVDFTPPSNVGGSAVSEYYAVVNPGNITATSVTPPVAVTGLTNGVEYTTKVWANNSYGPSPYSAESAGFTPVPTFIEDVFSTYLYTGNGTSQTITNGIDLAGEGGLVWIKQRSATRDNLLFDTSRGATQRLFSNLTLAQSQDTQSLTAFNSDGFSVGSDSGCNISAGTYASWTFRKQPKFFDVVTFTGDGVAGREIAHELGSTPGVMIIKSAIGATSSWIIYHRSLGATKSIVFTDSTPTVNVVWFNDTEPTSTHFTVGTYPNAIGVTYVAYLFAHDAGGFGESGSDNVISCGSYTGATDLNINLGYEPQWLLIKQTNTLGNWIMLDTMRGIPTGSSDAVLYANLTNAETSSDCASVNATGFQPLGVANTAGGTYIYMAIRRGPMKTPTSGTEVFQTLTWTGTGAASRNLTGLNFPPDTVNMIARTPTGAYASSAFYDRLRGAPILVTSSPQSESYWAGTALNLVAFGQDGVTLPANAGQWDVSSNTFAGQFFQRAPGFFDVVCLRPPLSTNARISHNLGVAPELVIVKKRNSSQNWTVYSESLGINEYLFGINTNSAKGTQVGAWGTSAPTSTDMGANTDYWGWNGTDMLFYMFATVPNVSKVGSYTGTAATLTIDCGFSAGARFVMIKRTDSTGNWYTWDSARGIIAGNDPYQLWNVYQAEVTNTDYIDTAATGFEISSTAPIDINASGGNYIFLAIA